MKRLGLIYAFNGITASYTDIHLKFHRYSRLERARKMLSLYAGLIGTNSTLYYHPIYNSAAINFRVYILR